VFQQHFQMYSCKLLLVNPALFSGPLSFYAGFTTIRAFTAHSSTSSFLLAETVSWASYRANGLTPFPKDALVLALIVLTSQCTLKLAKTVFHGVPDRLMLLLNVPVILWSIQFVTTSRCAFQYYFLLQASLVSSSFVRKTFIRAGNESVAI
jgi:hypothetical protein